MVWSLPVVDGVTIGRLPGMTLLWTVKPWVPLGRSAAFSQPLSFTNLAAFWVASTEL